MHDRNLLAPWVKRFLLEYLVAERNLARNTQFSYRDTLTLPSGQLLRSSVQQRFQPQDPGSLMYALVNFILRDLMHFHAEGHIVIDSHVAE